MESFKNLSSTILLDSLVPGYSFWHSVVLGTTGFDATRIIIGATIAVFAIRTLRKIWHAVWDIVSARLMSEIHVSSSDEIYGPLLHFLARQPQIKVSRQLIVDSTVMSDYDNGRSNAVVTDVTIVDGGSIQLYNFSSQRTSSLLRYTPAFGDFMIRYKRMTFWLSRKKLSSKGQSDGLRLLNRPQESLKISCFGRSPQPIKDLIQTARNDYFLERSQSTIIKRPSSKSTRGFSSGSSWLTVAQRPSRLLETIALEPREKMGLLKDINDYLQPASEQWYANRGIPYSRGYLFHGPPGTGKTSLTFALAGLFGLDIHVVSLLDPSLTEDELAMLFSHLPSKSIILLEDIDTAGMSRPLNMVDTEPEKVASQHEGSNSGRVTRCTSMPAAQQTGKLQALRQGNGISLSGLLNVIDGEMVAPYLTDYISEYHEYRTN
jgi:chaperone BCS1